MKKKFLFAIIICLPIYINFSFQLKENSELSTSKQKDEIIPWKADATLTWSDFKGKPDKSSPYKAMTFSSISSNLLVFSEKELKIEISCHFIKNKSWKKAETDELLKHEQVHFDITELAARKMRQRLSLLKLKDLNQNNIKAKLDKIFNTSTKEQQQMNKKYDSETDHSINKKEQEEWEVKIQNELEKLNEFSTVIVSIK